MASLRDTGPRKESGTQPPRLPGSSLRLVAASDSITATRCAYSASGDRCQHAPKGRLAAGAARSGGGAAHRVWATRILVKIAAAR